MEYYGKILCISYKDLTYDDRPVIREDGKADYSKSRALRGHHPSMLSMEELAPIMSVPNYKKLAARKEINVVRQGKGLGSYALIEIATMPLRFQERIKLKYGEMKEDILKINGRHDACIVPRVLPVIEAIMALAILDEIL